MARKKSGDAGSSANLGFEAKLWLAADKLRNNMDAAEYKHVVLGLIFLKYISDSFDEHHAKLVAGKGSYKGVNPEDPEEYRAENIFWVPKEARWSHLQGKAKQPTIGRLVDDAMVAIERANPRLKGVLPKNYARPALDKHRLGELIDLVGKIGLGDKENRAKDILGRVYECFLTQFASADAEQVRDEVSSSRPAVQYSGSGPQPPRRHRSSLTELTMVTSSLKALLSLAANLTNRIFSWVVTDIRRGKLERRTAFSAFRHWICDPSCYEWSR
ncbi:MAG: type I restriction-modification system subunit M N-terminal domain-containing protein [Pirellulales bacterium]